MWVWAIADPARLVEFSVARGISRLFVAVPVQLPTSPAFEPVAQLVARASRAGIDVDALGGDPAWIDEPQSIVESWLVPVIRSGLFGGVHVDVEPYAHDEWESDRAGTVRRYLTLLSAFTETSHLVTRLEADLPFWFHQVPAGGSTLDREVMRRVDAVTILAYRNAAAGPDGTIALASPQVAAAAELACTARIGQETNDLGADPECRKQTFHGHTLRQMEQELATVEAAFRGGDGAPTIAGIAIHDAAGYAAMAP